MASRTLRRRSTYRALGSHNKSRSRPILSAIVVALVTVTMLGSGASAAAMFFYGNNLPTLQNFKKRFQFQNTLVRDWYGNPLYDMADLSKGHGRRIVEPLAWPGHPASYYKASHEDWLTDTLPADHGIPVVLQDATIATEDATFYSNPGFDPFSIVRAAYDNIVKGHVVSGASTITQQLVRDYMLSPNPTLSRKAEEIILAAEVTQKYPKSQILWYYLNSVPYGPVSIGAEAAAQQYFHTDVWHLDLAQSALLAGLPEAPTVYDPVNNLPAALGRMQYVLHLMCQHGFLSSSHDPGCSGAIAAAMNETKKWPKFSPPVTIKRYPHFVEYAIEQLQQLSQKVPSLKGRLYDGLDVQTTLMPQLQKAAQDTVSGQISQLGAYNVTDGALVSMDLRSSCYGCIRAMVGSADYNNAAISGKINMADSPRQPGSSFKPFNYVLAFENGLGPGTTVLDGPIAIPDQGNPEDGGWYEPTDYDHQWHGTVSLRVALDNSLNVPAVKVEQFNASQPGENLQTVAGQAVKMGMKSLFQDNPNCCGWSLTLGGMEHGVRLVEETAAYGAFGTSGRTVPPVAIWQVKDRVTGKVLYQAWKDNPDRPKQVVPPEYAYLMTNILSDNSSRCTPTVCEFGLTSPLYLGVPAAAKTGTTNSFTDNWTVGYTPDIVTGVWVGNANNNPMVGTTGITGAAPIWHDYMLKALGLLKLPPKDFTQPPKIQAGSECRENSSLYTIGYGVYDIYTSNILPLCTVGSYDTSVPIPENNTTAPYSPPPAQPAPVQPTAAVQPTAPVQPAPTAVVPQATSPAQSVPGVQPGNPGAAVQPTQPAAPTPAPVQPTAQSPQLAPTANP